MQAIGERLREARTRRGLDIRDVEAATKVRSKYLRALENDEFELLPGPTFVKTFMRTYAEYLGLDAQLLVEEYRAQYEARELDVQPFVPATRQRERQRRRAPRGPSGPPGPGTAIVVAVLVLLAIFAILGITGGSGGGGTPTTHATHAHRTPTTPRHVASAPASPTQKPKPKPNATTVAMRVVPVGPTYVCVDHGPGTPPVINTVISSPVTFNGKHLRINAGKASVGLIVNNQRVQIPQSQLPIGYDFTPTSTKTIPPPQRPCIG